MYGQALTGKSRIMRGTMADPGIIPRIVSQLFIWRDHEDFVLTYAQPLFAAQPLTLAQCALAVVALACPWFFRCALPVSPCHSLLASSRTDVASVAASLTQHPHLHAVEVCFNAAVM